jgi:hypothetical protein
MPRAVVKSGLPGSDPFPGEDTRAVGAHVVTTSFDHLVTIERDAGSSGNDSWGNPGPETWVPHIVDQSCLGYTKDERGREVPGEPAGGISIEPIHVLFPTGTDIKPKDKLGNIRKADDTVVFEGPFLVTHPPYERASFLELIIEGVS